MSDNRFNSQGNNCKETVCIDTYRVLDSCRDKDCFQNAKVYLTCFGQEIIDRTNIVRAKYAKVVSSYIDIDQVPFNNGFYQLTIKIFVKIICEACLGAGNIQDFEGITVLEKKVILYGGEGSVSVFKSEAGCSAFCPSEKNCACNAGNTMPIAVIETVDPIILDTKVTSPSCTLNCCCACCDIPDIVTRCVGGELVEGDVSNILTVSLGLFSVVRIERPAQILVSAAEYSVPEKECVEAKEDDPCSIFRNIPFPVGEFNSTSPRCINQNDKGCSCGC